MTPKLEVVRVRSEYKATVPIESAHFEIVYQKDQRPEAGVLSGVTLKSSVIYLWRKGDSTPWGIEVPVGGDTGTHIPAGMQNWIADEMRSLAGVEK